MCGHAGILTALTSTEHSPPLVSLESSQCRQWWGRGDNPLVVSYRDTVTDSSVVNILVTANLSYPQTKRRWACSLGADPILSPRLSEKMVRAGASSGPAEI